MKLEKTAGEITKGESATASLTPSTALLHRKLGTCPTPRTLTPSEIELLRQAAKEIAEVTREVLRADQNSPDD